MHLLLTIVISSESTAVLHFRCTEHWHWHTLAHSVRRQQSATTHKAVRQTGTCSPPFTPLLSTAILFLSLSFSLSLSSHRRHWLQTISECSLTHSPSSAHNCTPTDAGADTTTKHSLSHSHNRRLLWCTTVLASSAPPPASPSLLLNHSQEVCVCKAMAVSIGTRTRTD